MVFPLPSSTFNCLPVSWVPVFESAAMWGSCLDCQVLPAIDAVSILELAANSGSRRMSEALNLHFNSNKVVNNTNKHAFMTMFSLLGRV